MGQSRKMPGVFLRMIVVFLNAINGHIDLIDLDDGKFKTGPRLMFLFFMVKAMVSG